MTGACLVLAPLSCAKPVDNSDTVALGLLLPFSGSETGTAANFERAAILAAEHINAAGGIRGKRLRLVGADTHSSVEHGKESAERLINEELVAVLGMESSEIALEVEPALYENDVALISPLVGISDDTSVECTNRWFRLAPSAKTMGEALAKQLIASHVPSIVVLRTPDAYSTTFGDSLAGRFVSLGGEVSVEAELDPTATSHDKILKQVIASHTSDIVLSAPPRVAAWVANEVYVTFSAKVNWYLSPLLKTEVLIQNAAPGALNGAKGVAPKIFERKETFSRTFEERWDGDVPLEGAYFYFDAVILAAYALQLASSKDDGAVSAEAFKDAMVSVTRPVGITTSWNELDRGLEAIAKEQPVYYAGVTGPVNFDACGARRIGAYRSWSVRAGKIVDEAEE